MKMKQPYLIRAQKLHPVWQVTLTIAAVGVLGALFALGLILFAVLAAVGLVAGSVIWLRLWWAGRALRARSSRQPEVLEGEFVVVKRRQLDKNRSEPNGSERP